MSETLGFGGMSDTDLRIQVILDQSRLRRQLAEAEARMGKFFDTVKSMGRAFTTYVTAPVVGFGAASVKAFAQFDQAIIDSTSIMNNLKDSQFDAMRGLALQLGTKTIHGPTELAKAYEFLALAGKSAEQSLSLLPIVSKFATAGAFDLKRATDLLTDAQTAMGMASKDAGDDLAQMTRLANVLVKANTLANANTSQFAFSLMRQAGPAFKSFGKSVEEGTALLAAYASGGVKGEMAGTMAARFVNLLGSSALKNAAAHKQLGFSVFDAGGKMRHFADIVENLEQVLGRLTPEAKMAALAQLGFAARTRQAVLPLLGMSKEIRQWDKELRDATGFIDTVAAKRLKTFTNQIKITWNQLQVMGIEIGGAVAPALTRMNEGVQSAIRWWMGLSNQVKAATGAMLAFSAAIGPVLLGAAALRGAWLFLGGAAIGKGLVSSLFAVLNPVRAMGAAFAAVRIAAGAAFGPVGVGLAVASVALGLVVEKMGGFASAWDKVSAWATQAWASVQSSTASFLEWLDPVIKAAGSLFSTVWETLSWAADVAIVQITANLTLLWDAVSWVGSAIADYFGITWNDVRDAAVDAMIGAEFAIRSFGAVASYVWDSAVLGIMRFGAEVYHTFRERMPAVLIWFRDNFADVMYTAGSYALAVIKNIGTNFYEVFSNLPGLLSGAVAWEDVWTPLTKGAFNAIKSLPDIPDRIIGKVERQMMEDVQRQADALGQSFDEFRKAKLEAFGKQGLGKAEAELKEFGKAAEKAGLAIGKGAQAGARQAFAAIAQIDAALFGSAESLSRFAAYSDMLAARGPAGPAGADGAPAGNAKDPVVVDPADGADMEGEDSVALLKDIAESNRVIAKRPPVKIGTANA